MPFEVDDTNSGGFLETKNPDTSVERDFFSETLPAAFRLENTIGSTGQYFGPIFADHVLGTEGNNEVLADPFEFIRPEDSNDDIKSYASVVTLGDLRRLHSKLDQEKADREVVFGNGASGIGPALIAGIFDPINFIPVGGALYKGFRTGGSILRNAGAVGAAGFLSSTASESVLQSTQETRTAGESVLNIAAGTMFSALLGGGASAIAHQLSKAPGGRTLTTLQDHMEHDLTVMTTPPRRGADDVVGVGVDGGSVGAAKTLDLDHASRTRISEEVDRLILDGKLSTADAPKELAERFAKELVKEQGIKTNLAVDMALQLVKNLDPGIRLMTNDLVSARVIGPELFESSLTLARNALDVATPASAEAIAKDFDGNLYRFLTGHDDAYTQYALGRAKHFGDIARLTVTTKFNKNDTKLSPTEFKNFVGRAAMRGDDASSIPGVPTEAVPFINKSAVLYRKEIVEPMTKKAIDLGLLPEDVSVDTAASYFTRMYDIDKLTSSKEARANFIGSTKKWLLDRQGESIRRTGTFNDEIEVFRGEIKKLRQEIKAVTEGVGTGTRSGVIEPTQEAVDILVNGLEGRIGELVDETAERLAFRGKAEGSAMSAFFKSLKKDLQKEVETAVSKEVGEEAGKIFDDIVGQADELVDADLLKVIKEELATAGEDIGAPAALGAVRNSDALGKAQQAASKAFSKSIKAQEARLKRLLENPDQAALEKIRIEILKTANKEAREAVRAATKDARRSLQNTLREFSDRKRLNLRDINDATKLDGEFESIAEEILERIIGSPAGRLPYDVAPQALNKSMDRGSSLAAPLHKRAFGIQDIMIEDALITDVEVVAKNFIHSMGPDLALVEKFGDIDMTKQFKTIKDDAADLIRKATTDKEVTRINAQADSAIADLMAIRDRIRNTHGLSDDPMSWTQRVGRGALQLNLVTKLGGMTASAIPDIGRPVMVNGLINTFSDGFIPLITNFKNFGKLTTQIRRDLGGASDMITNARMQAIGDTLHNDYARGNKLERGLTAASESFGMASLMAPWNTAWKQFSGAVSMGRITRAIMDDVAGKINGKEREFLRSTSIPQGMARKIAAQLDEFKQVEGGITLPNVSAWVDKGAARAFRMAVRREIDRTIITPGAADRPTTATSTMVGRVIFQFKSFALSATNKIFLSGLQQADMAAMNGLVMSVTLGMMATAFKAWDADRGAELDEWTMTKWVTEGVDRSGSLGILSDANNILEKATRGSLGFSAFTGGQQMSRFASRNVAGAILGPSFGALSTLGAVVGNSAATAFGDGAVTAADITAIRRLIPYNNIIILRQGFQKLEEAADRGLGIR